jgi:hypothetical protein
MRECLLAVLNEEWGHRLHAERDLAAWRLAAPAIAAISRRRRGPADIAAGTGIKGEELSPAANSCVADG